VVCSAMVGAVLVVVVLTVVRQTPYELQVAARTQANVGTHCWSARKVMFQHFGLIFFGDSIEIGGDSGSQRLKRLCLLQASGTVTQILLHSKHEEPAVTAWSQG